MNNFIFENRTKVYFGKGCVKEYLSSLAGNYGERIMLCYGCGSVKTNGILEEVRGILEAEGKEIVEFDGIMSNPTYEKVLEGAALAKKKAGRSVDRTWRRFGYGLLQGSFYGGSL